MGSLFLSVAGLGLGRKFDSKTQETKPLLSESIQQDETQNNQSSSNLQTNSKPTCKNQNRSIDKSEDSEDECFDSIDDDDVDEIIRVYDLVHRIRLDLLTLIDTPLSFEQLTSPAITFSITRPLERTYLSLNHPAIIFALLVNRVQFINDSTHALTLHSVNATRASLCEILATNLLRKSHESVNNRSLNQTGRSTPIFNRKFTREDEEAALLKSSNAIATAFCLFDGAPDNVIESLEFDFGSSDAKKIVSRQSNALEMAIVGEAKQFIRSPACQKVIDAIWTGKIVYTSTAIVDILSDRYKHRPVSLYNPRNAPLLNHYRLTVPRNRTALEYCHYFVLIVSYVLTLYTREFNRMNLIEIWFNIFTLGFGVDKLGSILEHGWLVFIANLWNGLDLAFIVGYLVYLGLRVTGLVYLNHYQLESHWLNRQSHQVLSCMMTLIFPRLAFITLSNNLLILSLRSMLSDFLFLMFLGSWCFVGFLYSLYLLQNDQDQGLSNGSDTSFYSMAQIAEWMVFIFFGLDSTGISKAHEFHKILGPAIFIIYACLSNTLLVTVMVSILSKIFSDISNDAIAETLYRKAVLTFEGVKSDAIFSFQPPFNIPAMFILITIKPFLTPRKFHTVVVFMCRFFGCPVLLTISFFERYLIGPFEKEFSLKLSVVNSLGGLAGVKNSYNNHGPTRRNTMSKMSSTITRNLKKFGGLDVINACFYYEDDRMLDFKGIGTQTPISDQEGRMIKKERKKNKKGGKDRDGKKKDDGAVAEEDRNATIRDKKHEQLGVVNSFLEEGLNKSRTKENQSTIAGGFFKKSRPSALEKLFLPQVNLVTSFLVNPSAISEQQKVQQQTSSKNSSDFKDNHNRPDQSSLKSKTRASSVSSSSSSCGASSDSSSPSEQDEKDSKNVSISKNSKKSLSSSKKPVNPSNHLLRAERSFINLAVNKPASIIQDEENLSRRTAVRPNMRVLISKNNTIKERAKSFSNNSNSNGNSSSTQNGLLQVDTGNENRRDRRRGEESSNIANSSESFEGLEEGEGEYLDEDELERRIGEAVERVMERDGIRKVIEKVERLERILKRIEEKL
ncbi:expressed protein [Phakopsora pachyrhizi]|uniref:Expressed protein n=1 Tax=Phakopsora pachyrhizi TaxID=170000 RepID=A0AAV0B5K9_PHAPC|nr:expressed protein [Phakopsora pachyrhizi]